MYSGVPAQTVDGLEAQRVTIEKLQAGDTNATPHVSAFAESFAKKLWGDLYFDDSTRKFSRKPIGDRPKRSFVQFVLEPLYKMFSQVVGEDPKDLEMTLRELGVRLKKSELQLDSGPLLRLVLQQFFGPPTAFIDLCVSRLASPLTNIQRKVENIYTGMLSWVNRD